MNTNKKILFLSLSGVAVLGATLFAFQNGNYLKLSSTQETGDNYSFLFEKNKNELDASGTSAVVLTKNSNPVTFYYSNLSSFDDGWMSFEKDGSFFNPKLNDVHGNKISGLKTIKANYDGEGQLLISYGWLHNNEYEYKNQLLENNSYFTFDSTYPTYFRITNLNDCVISVDSIEIEYSCNAGEIVTPPYSIQIDENNGNSYQVSTNSDGSYDLPTPIKYGYTFSKWIDENENTFNSSGVISSNKMVTAIWEADNTETFRELYDKAYAGVEYIKITGNIEMTGTVYIRGNTTIYSDGNYTLTRASSNTKRLFTVSSGSLTFGMDGHNGIITVDGNKENAASSQAGACIYSSGAAKTVNLHKNIVFRNSKVDGQNGAVIYIDGGILNIDCAQFYNNTTIEASGVNGGAIYMKTSGATLNINETSPNSVVFENNVAAYGGGAIYAASGTILNITGGTFRNNSVTGNASSVSYGGDIYLASQATINGASFEGSSSVTKGGSVYCSANSQLTIEDSSFDGSNSGEGGAIMLNGSNLCTIENCTFENNSSSSTGGAISCGNSVELEVISSSFNANTCATNGGGIYSSKSDIVSVVSSSFTANESTSSGGAIYVDEDTESFSVTGSSSFVENITHGHGGAIYVGSADSFTLQGSDDNRILFDGNTASESSKNGAAFYLYSCPSISISYATFINNAATNGGVAYVHTATATFSNCIFGTSGHGNRASNNGGVFLMASNSHVTVENSSATDNYGNRGGFAVVTGAGDMTIKNLIASNNTAKKAANGHFILSRSTATVYTDSSQITYNGSTVADLTTIIFAEGGTSGTMQIEPIPAQ